MPIERLLSPRQRLAGQRNDAEIWALFPLKKQSLQSLNEDTDCIKILDSINGYSFDHLSDLLEHIQTDNFYLEISKNNGDESTLIHLCTTLKYVFLSKRLLQLFVADDTAFSFHLPFLTEAIQDIECSLYLMKGDYFKQSLQTLRNALEVTLLHAYFALNYLEDEELDNVLKQRQPPMKEVIVNLRQFGVLTDKMEQQYFHLYKLLSSAVHSELSKLSVANSFSNKRSFSEWYSSFTAVADLTIRTSLRMAEVGL